MTLLDRLALLTTLDAAAVGFLFLCWLTIGWWIEREGAARPSVSVLMTQYRSDWMREMVTRDSRIFDAQLLASLRQGTAFFASTCVLAIGGALALIGNAEQLLGVAEEFSLAAVPALIWQVKLSLAALLLISAFLRFVWSNRLFAYCAVLMGAVPNDPTHPDALPRAAQAAALNSRAAANFNRGLRSMYFSLASLAWVFGPLALFGATVTTLWVLWSHEFRSRPHAVLTSPPGAKP